MAYGCIDQDHPNPHIRRLCHDRGARINLQEIFGADKDGLKELFREVLQEVLEQKMTDAIGAEKA